MRDVVKTRFELINCTLSVIRARRVSMASALSYSKTIVKTFNTRAGASERKILIEKFVMTNVNDLSISITKSKYSQRSGRCLNSEDEKVKPFRE